MQAACESGLSDYRNGVLVLVREDIIDTDLKLAALLPSPFGHILQPSNNGDAIVSFVTIINKARTQVLCGIVGQGCFGDGTATGRFPVADSDVALAFLQLVNLDGQATCILFILYPYFSTLFTSFLNTSRPEKPMVLKV